MTKTNEYLIDIFWLGMLSLAVALGQTVGLKMSFINTLPMALAITVVCMLSIVLKNVLPKKVELPTFAWAMILGLLISMGNTPVSRWIMAESGNLQFISTTTPILAFVGLSMVNQISELKKLSWRVVLISVFVFTFLFFICAGVAHLVMKVQGLI